MADKNTTNLHGSLFELKPKDPLLEFHPDTVSTLRKLYNLNDDKDMNTAIDILDKWIKEQRHFRKKDFPRKYLEATLISMKGSLERAKQQIEKLCTLKTLLARFYDISDPIEESRCFEGKFQQALLPKLTKQHHRIYVSRFLSTGLGPVFFFKTLKFAIAICEYIKSNDYSDGLIAIADYRNVNIVSFLSEVNMSDMRQAAALVMDGYQCRLKGIHLITESKTVDLLVILFKQLVRPKIAQRIHCHQNCDTLHQYVPKELLPVELGGEKMSMQTLNDKTVELIGSKENMPYFKEMKEATIDESMRPKGSAECDSEIFGTFRSLSID